MRRLLWRARRRLLPPGPGRHRLVGRRVVCSCHGRDLTEMRDADVLALHPLPRPDAFARAYADAWPHLTPLDFDGFVKATPDGIVPLDAVAREDP